MTHIDEFIDQCVVSQEESLRYVAWFFTLHRLPAAEKMAFAAFIAPHKLFCDYEGVRYRVTGCSRMGDIWLRKNHKLDSGYDHRVDVDECSNWGKFS